MSPAVAGIVFAFAVSWTSLTLGRQGVPFELLAASKSPGLCIRRRRGVVRRGAVRVRMARRRRTDGRSCGLCMRRLCLLALPVALPSCVIEIDTEGDSCSSQRETNELASLSVEVEDSWYCDALCGDSACAPPPKPRPPVARRTPHARTLQPPQLLTGAVAATRRFDRGACFQQAAYSTQTKSTMDVAILYSPELSSVIDSFEQVGGADTACRSRAKRDSDDNYYDRWFTVFVYEEQMYQDRARCEFLCASDNECVAYEFQYLGTRATDGTMQGVCEKWRQGPVFESATDGPSRQGGPEPDATGYSCWQRVRGGKVKSAAISGCPLSIVSLGLYSLGSCVAVLVVVCCTCQAQKKRIGDVTIDQSGFVPPANIDSTPRPTMSPDQIRALQAEREALEAGLGMPGSDDASERLEQEPGPNGEPLPRLEQSSDLAANDEIRPSGPPGAPPLPPSPLPPSLSPPSAFSLSAES